jgi:hypothetical protein
MREKNYLKGFVTLTLLSVLIGLTLILTSCKHTSTTISTPQEIQWGKKGIVPDKVFTDYDWVIISTERYLHE